jgi:hypothetical protein
MRRGVLLKLDFLFDLSEMVPEGASAVSPPVGTNDKKVSGLSCFRIHGWRRRVAQLAKFAEEFHRFIADRDYAFGVQLAERYMKDPRSIRFFSQGVDLQIKKFLHAQPRVTQEEQSLVNEPASLAEFFLEKPICLLRERTGEIAICGWHIAMLEKFGPRRLFPAPLPYFA